MLTIVNHIIKQGVLVNDVLENDDNVEKDTDYETISASDDGVACWKTWAQKIFTTAEELAKQSVDGNVLNALYNPIAASKLKDLMAFIPLWTGIMRPHFKIGSTVAKSSPVEGAFSNLKNVVFEGRLPMRVDKFVIEHLNYLDGKLRLLYVEHNKIKNISNPEITSLDFTIKPVSIEKTQNSTISSCNKTSLDTTMEDTVEINNITKQLSLNKIKECISWSDNEIKIIKLKTEASTLSIDSLYLLEKSTKLNALSSEFIATFTPLKEEPQKERNTFIVSNENEIEIELNNKENWRGEGKSDIANNKRKRKIDTNDGNYRKKT